MADLDPQILCNAIEWVYTAFFCSDTAQHLRSIEEILIGHFMNTLNDIFKWELNLEDGGYKSGSESLSIPTPLCRAPHLSHVSACENLSFTPATPRAHSPQQPGNLTTVHHHLMFEEDDDSSLDSNTLHTRYLHTAYPCPYSLDQLHLTLDYAPQYMDLSDIFDFPDVITTASDEDIPNLEDVLQILI